MATALVNRPSLALMPPVAWPDLLASSFMRVAPPGLSAIFTAMCGSCANENAYKVRVRVPVRLSGVSLLLFPSSLLPSVTVFQPSFCCILCFSRCVNLLRVCLCLCVYVFVPRRLCACQYVWSSVSVHVATCVTVCVYMPASLFVDVCVHICVYIFVCVRVRVHVL